MSKEIQDCSCYKCKWLEYIEDEDSDGYVNERNSGYVCNGDKPEGIRNLKHFPFRTAQKCCEQEGNVQI